MDDIGPKQPEMDIPEKTEKMEIRGKSTKRPKRTSIRDTLRETALLTEYLRNGHNGTQAAYATYNVTTDKSAGVVASRVLNKVSVRQELEAYVEAQRAGIQVQLSSLVEIASGKYKSTTVTTTTDPRGGVTVSETVKQCTAGDRINAIATIAKLTGWTDVNRAKGQALSAELKRMFKQLVSPPVKDAALQAAQSPIAGPVSDAAPEAVPSTTEDAADAPAVQEEATDAQG